MRSLVVAALAVFLPATVAASWQTTLVDSTTENVGTAIRLGAGGGIIHVAYYSSAGLKYARHDTSGWFLDTLDTWTGPHNRGPSLELDSLGRPWIAYYRGTPRLARWDGSRWQYEEIDADSSGDYISLAFDSVGGPQVAYNKRVGLTGSRLKYAWRDSASWHPELVDAASSGNDCVLGVDRDGRRAVADCESWSSGALFYRVRTESGWTKQTLLAGDASQSCLAFDSVGRPRISYYWTGGEDFDLRFAQTDGDSWRFDLVDHGRQQNKRGWDNCLALDARGICHISYHAHNERELRYAWGRFGSWTVEVVDQVGMWNLMSSIAVDYRGRAFIAYCDEDEGDALYLAIRDEPVGIEEKSLKPIADGQEPMASVVRGVLFLPVSVFTTHPSLFSLDGRKVMELAPGPNDVSGLAPRVYFVRQAAGVRRDASCATRVLVLR